MIKECNVIINNGTVAVVDFNGTKVQIPFVGKDMKSVFIEKDGNEYRVVSPSKKQTKQLKRQTVKQEENTEVTEVE